MKALKDLKEIEEDCLKLKRRNDLTEFEKGELYVVQVARRLKIEKLIMIIYKMARGRNLNKSENKVIEKVIEWVDFKE